MMARWLMAGSAWWAATAVALGAFGAHALGDHLAEIHPPQAVARMAANWETAARYHLIHALASILATFMAIGFGSPNLASTRAASTRGDSTRGRIEPPFWFWLPSLCFLLGTLIFSGCLYLMVLGGPKVLGAVVPIGGLLMILGWLILGGVAFRSCTLSESIAGDRSRPPASE